MQVNDTYHSGLQNDQSPVLNGAVQKKQENHICCPVSVLAIGVILALAFLPPAFCCISSLSPSGAVAFLILGCIGIKLAAFGLASSCCAVCGA